MREWAAQLALLRDLVRGGVHALDGCFFEMLGWSMVLDVHLSL